MLPVGAVAAPSSAHAVVDTAVDTAVVIVVATVGRAVGVGVQQTATGANVACDSRQRNAALLQGSSALSDSNLVLQIAATEIGTPQLQLSTGKAWKGSALLVRPSRLHQGGALVKQASSKAATALNGRIAARAALPSNAAAASMHGRRRHHRHTRHSARHPVAVCVVRTRWHSHTPRQGRTVGSDVMISWSGHTVVVMTWGHLVGQGHHGHDEAMTNEGPR